MSLFNLQNVGKTIVAFDKEEQKVYYHVLGNVKEPCVFRISEETILYQAFLAWKNKLFFFNDFGQIDCWDSCEMKPLRSVDQKMAPQFVLTITDAILLQNRYLVVVVGKHPSYKDPNVSLEIYDLETHFSIKYPYQIPVKNFESLILFEMPNHLGLNFSVGEIQLFSIEKLLKGDWNPSSGEKMLSPILVRGSFEFVFNTQLTSKGTFFLDNSNYEKQNSAMYFLSEKDVSLCPFFVRDKPLANFSYDDLYYDEGMELLILMDSETEKIAFFQQENDKFHFLAECYDTCVNEGECKIIGDIFVTLYNRGDGVVSVQQYLIPFFTLGKLLAAGLTPEENLDGENSEFFSFLTKGLYDPRLFCLIFAFVGVDFNRIQKH